jgi:4-hydroxy-2-oxoheptanedioate aldolase
MAVMSNEAKRRMLNGRPAIGAPVGLGSPLAAELLSLAGFDFVLVDNQHGAWDDNTTMLAFRTIALGSAVPMARVRWNDFYAIGRLLDRGALGIVVPMINSVEEARAAAFAARYPPEGGRSVGAFGAQFHGPDYMQWINDEVVLAVQIESQQAVDRAEQILSVPGVDGCWVGPADLANSMGVDPNTPEGSDAREAAILSVLGACRRTGKIPGIAGGDRAGHWIEQGFLFVTTSGDDALVASGGRETLRSLGRSV